MNKMFILFTSLLYVCLVNAQNTVARYRIETGKEEQTILHFGASDGWACALSDYGLMTDKTRLQTGYSAQTMMPMADPKGHRSFCMAFQSGCRFYGTGRQRTNQFRHPVPDVSWKQTALTTGTSSRDSATFWNWQKTVALIIFSHSWIPYLFTIPKTAWPPIPVVAVLPISKMIVMMMWRVLWLMQWKDWNGHDGIHFDYICPVNEPDGSWNWLGPKQERFACDKFWDCTIGERDK